MAHIVILGAGIGGLPAAYELRQTLSAGHRVTVISASESFEFVPSNPWVAVGWRERDQISFPLRPALERHGIGFIAQRVTCLDAPRSRLTLADGTTVDYDYLVITTGAKLAFDEVPGAGPNGFAHSICTTENAEAAWAGYRQLLEEPGPVVIGALPGASCFGPVYEFAFIVDADLRRRRLRHKVPITFVTSEPYIGHLGLGGVGNSRGLLEAGMREHHIKWITNARVDRIEAGKMFVTQVSEKGGATGELELPFRYSMMLPAFRGTDAVAAAEALCDARGFVLVNDHQRSRRYRNIFAAGVCIAIPPVEATPVPTGAPKTGHMIETMVTAIVENIRADLDGRPAWFKATWNAICLADMGDTGVAFVAMPQMPPRNLCWMKQGRWVHWMKVAFEKYFLHKMKTGNPEPLYEKFILRLLGLRRLDKAA